MASFERILEKLLNARTGLSDVGTQIVEQYPNSPMLTQMTTEISVAVTALDTLTESIKQALQDAENDSGVYDSILEQMKESETYEQLSTDEREQIAEWLVQNQQGLASDEILLGYVEKSLSQKSSSDLIAMYPKALITKLGQEADDGSEDFDAYSAGLEKLRRDFDNDKSLAVKELAKTWLDRGLDSVVREFYAEALQPREEEGMEDER